MLKTFARALAAGAFVLAAVLPTTASAGGGGGGGTPGAITIQINPIVTVSGKQLLTVNVTETCPLLLDFNGLPVVDQFGSVSVQEVRGNVIAHAFGQLMTVCDGVSHTSAVTLLAQDHPFHGGTGVATAAVFQICGNDPITFAFVCVNGSDTQTVSIVAVH